MKTSFISLEESFKSKKVLITGGLGFIGSNLAARLLPLGADITLVDSLIPEYGGNLYNVEKIKKYLHINISDVRDTYGMKHLIKNKDILFNLAGQTSHMDSLSDPFADLNINCKAQLSILETCKEVNKDISIVFAGTRQVYGKPQYLPVDENHTINPTDINGINKVAGEWYHILYNNIYGIRACSLRLTNTIGPRMRIKDSRQTFVGIWIRRVLENSCFEVWEGTQLRDFTYINDCIDALLLAAVHPKAAGKIYNLGGKDNIALRHLAELLIKIAGQGTYQLRKFPEERKKIDIGDYYSDFSKITSELGWQPQTDIKTALKKTYGYFLDCWDKYYI